jgi:transposase-like protein
MELLVCPVCKSANMQLNAGGYTGKYRCKNCEYVGFAIEMTEGEYKELVKESKGKERAQKPGEIH